MSSVKHIIPTSEELNVMPDNELLWYGQDYRDALVLAQAKRTAAPLLIKINELKNELNLLKRSQSPEACADCAGQRAFTKRSEALCGVHYLQKNTESLRCKICMRVYSNSESKAGCDPEGMTQHIWEL